MTDSPDFDGLRKEQAKLQSGFEAEQKKYQSARARFATAKGELTAFNDKYGRALKLIVTKEADEAEAATVTDDNSPAEE